MRTVLLFATLLSAGLHAGWFSQAAPTPIPAPAIQPTALPTPVRTLRHGLLQMKRDKKLVAYAVVDAFTELRGGALTNWQLNVTYYFPAPKGKPMGSTSRSYSPSVATQIGGQPIEMDLGPGKMRFPLPTPDGLHAIPMDGRYVINSHFDLSGTARVDLPPYTKKQLAKAKKAGKKLPSSELWEAKSVPSFQNLGMTIRE
jgi:hypothetical protein